MVKLAVIVFTADTWVTPPVKPTPVGADHVYWVPAGTIPFTPLVGVTTKATPLQVTLLIAPIVAFGLIVSEIVKEFPGQVPDTVETVYVAT